MNLKSLKSKYHILVVKDQSKYSQIALQNSVNLAKMIGGSIDLLFVKSPSLVASYENQLAALRELNKEGARTKQSLKSIVELISATERIPITYNYTSGNIIHEVQRHINITRPDIVVLGKRKTKVTGLFGMDLTSYLLKNFKGALLISGEERALISHNDIVLGLLDDMLIKDECNLSEDLEKCTSKPITLLKINTLNNSPMEQTVVTSSKGSAKHTGMTTFEFDYGANISNIVSKYIQKSGVSLLCVRKSKLLDLNKKLKSVTKQIKKTIQKTRTPVLVLEN